MHSSPTPIRSKHRHRARRRAIGALVAAASMTVFVGCSKTPDVATGDTSTTVGTSAPASEGTVVEKPSGTSTTTKPTDSSTTSIASSRPTVSVPQTIPGAKPTVTLTPKSTVVVAPADKPICDKIDEFGAVLMKADVKDPATIVRFKEAFTELIPLAPSEIKAALETINDAVQEMTTVEDMAKLSDDPALKPANDEMTAWTKAHC